MGGEAVEEPQTAAAETTAQEQRKAGVRGRPFAPGVSGNPAGRPKGSRNKTTRLCEELLSGDAAAIMAAAIDGAKAGKPVALRLCVDRLIPSRRERTVDIDVQQIARAGDLVAAMSDVITQAAHGEMTLPEAREFAGLLELQRKAIETAEIAVKVDLLLKQSKDAGLAPVGVASGPHAPVWGADRRRVDASEELAMRDQVEKLAEAGWRVRVSDPPAGGGQ